MDLSLALLPVAAFFGGALNAVAGGGSFVLFPAMVFSGLSPRDANASTTVGLWPSALSGLGGYRDRVTSIARLAIPLAAASLAGGLGGAVLLLRTPAGAFQKILPFMLLGATLLFAAGPAITKRLARGARNDEAEGDAHAIDAHAIDARAIAAGALVQLVVATYGGYFGGGMGILMLATFSLMGMRDVTRMNALKVVLNVIINGIATVTFVSSGVVQWRHAALAAAGSVVGGYAGARAGTRLDARVLRAVVIVVGLALTVRFFVR